MKRLNSIRGIRKRRHSLSDGTSSAILAIFFSFFFVFAQAADFVAPGVEHGPIDRKAPFYGTHFLKSHNQSHHAPFGSVPIPAESESKDEREKNHESDEDSEKLFAILSLKERFQVSSDSRLLAQLLSSRQNRKELSLVVLHHSWKSFLS
ncbi:MAG TPA: hypothetical protein VGD65_06875 [Chryseosolibacter sp.]